MGRWESVEDIVSSYSQREGADLATALHNLGYSTAPKIRMGSNKRGFKVEVYEAERDESVPAACYVNLSIA
jgi:hypothetical protein